MGTLSISHHIIFYIECSICEEETAAQFVLLYQKQYGFSLYYIHLKQICLGSCSKMIWDLFSYRKLKLTHLSASFSVMHSFFYTMSLSTIYKPKQKKYVCKNVYFENETFSLYLCWLDQATVSINNFNNRNAKHVEINVERHIEQKIKLN